MQIFYIFTLVKTLLDICLEALKLKNKKKGDCEK